MRKLAFLFLAALPIHAQNWSASIGSGPFVFGHFAERASSIGNEGGTSTTRSRLSATTRAGATADIERDFGRWVGVRLEAAWTRSPLSIKSSSGGSNISLGAGRIDGTEFAAPLVVHLNRGAFRFQVLAGPAYALYTVHRRVGGAAELFDGTRGRWGGMTGLGATWWLRPRFGVEWQAAGVITQSPFRAEDIAPNGRGVRILRPKNGHTTLGIRYRF